MPGFYLESETFRAALKLFERMEIAEVIYESFGENSQTKQTRADSNQASRRKKQGGESTSPSVSEKKHAHKRNIRTNMYIYIISTTQKPNRV